MAKSKFNSEVFKRFASRNTGKIEPNSDNRVKFSKRSDIPHPTEASSAFKYGPNRPMPTVPKQKDQESNHPHHHHHKRRHRDDFPRSTKHHKLHPNHPDHPNHPNHHPDNNNHPDHPHHKTVESNKPQPHQHSHPNKTPDPLPHHKLPTPVPHRLPPSKVPTNTGPLPPRKYNPRNSKYDFTPDRNGLKFPPSGSKYGPNRPMPTDPTPTPTPTPKTYPTGSKYGPNRPMPSNKMDPSTRGSKYDFTTKSGNKTFDSNTLIRKLNRRRNGG